jgi:tetratricopeptide (TPR) repeat protein
MRLRRSYLLFFVWLAVVFGSKSGWAAQDTRKFLDGIAFYKSEQYKEAITTFNALADNGIVNAKLYYNLGNAYLKIQDIGHAVLWYERARIIDGNDPDLLFNLSYARSLIKDAPYSTDPGLDRIFFFWKYRLSGQTILMLAITFNGLFWLLLLLKALITAKRRALAVSAFIVAIPTLIFVFTAIYNYYETSQNHIAVVLPEEVSVRSGFSEHSTELFVLHAGTMVKIQKRQGNFLRISYSKAKIGWIRQTAVGQLFLD